MNKVKTARPGERPVKTMLHDGESLLDEGKYKDAARQAKAALAADPNHLGALELLARALWRAGEYEYSLDALRHVIRLNPYEPAYHYMRAVALQSLGHYGEAIRAFSRCVDGPEKLSQTVAASIRDLESWQETLIAEMLKSDAAFRQKYAMDPMKACHEKGFAFAAEDVAVTMRLHEREAAMSFAVGRPS